MGNTSRCRRSYVYPYTPIHIANNQQPPLPKQQRKTKQEQVKAITQIHAKIHSISNDMEGRPSLLKCTSDLVFRREEEACSLLATIYTDMRTMTRLDLTLLDKYRFLVVIVVFLTNKALMHL